MPVILVPIHFDRHYKLPQYFPSICRSFCLRPFITRDFMTGQAALPGRDIPEKVENVDTFSFNFLSHLFLIKAHVSYNLVYSGNGEPHHHGGEAGVPCDD